jgi:rubredoxin
MTRWHFATFCSILDKAAGAPSTGTAPGTPFAALPGTRRRLVCGAARDAFVLVDGTRGTGVRVEADPVMAGLAADRVVLHEVERDARRFL